MSLILAFGSVVIIDPEWILGNLYVHIGFPTLHRKQRRCTTPYPKDKYWSGTLDEATAVCAQGGARKFHLVHYEGDVYGFMSHIMCEWCDYCDEEREEGADVHEYAAGGPYLLQNLRYVQDRIHHAVKMGLKLDALLDYTDIALWKEHSQELVRKEAYHALGTC